MSKSYRQYCYSQQSEGFDRPGYSSASDDGSSSASTPTRMTSRQVSPCQSFTRRSCSYSSSGISTRSALVIPRHTTHTFKTLWDIDTPSRSKSILGNVPGSVPGGHLGLARSAKLSMKQYASPRQIAVGIANANYRAIAGGRGR